MTPDDRRKDDRVSSEVLTLVLETLRRVEDRIAAHGAETRVSFADMRKLLDSHIQDDNELANRVLKLENAREFEEKQSVKRGAIAALIVSGLLQLLLWTVRKLMGGP